MFPPTGQCTGIRVKEVGDDAPRRDAWLCGNRRSEGNRPLRKATRPRVAVHKSLLVVATPASSRTLIFLLIATSPFLPSPPLSVCLSFCVCGVPSARPSSISLTLLPSLPLPSPRLPTAQSSMRVHEYTNHHHVSNLSPCPRSSQTQSYFQSLPRAVAFGVAFTRWSQVRRRPFYLEDKPAVSLSQGSTCLGMENVGDVGMTFLSFSFFQMEIFLIPLKRDFKAISIQEQIKYC